MPTRSPIPFRHTGGPTLVLEWAGLTIVTDPTFDEPGDYPTGSVTLHKTTAPTVPAETLGSIDVVLISHDQHPDNLDHAGRALAARAKLVLSTPEAASRNDGIVGLQPWTSHTITLPSGGQAVITATPARHGPEGTEELTGPVTGFHLTADDQPTIYITGDTVAVDHIRQVRDRLGPVDLLAVHAGAARIPGLDADLSLTADQVVQVAQIFDPAAVLVIHTDNWAHFTQDRQQVTTAMTAAGLADRLVDAA